MTNPSKSKCLIVLGMHRSGTSALSGALTIAGLNPGKQLFNPEEDNPKGNFENARITKLNESILAELFARWNDTLLIPDNWWSYERFVAYSQKINQIIMEEIKDGQSILIKDPRLSILLPLYLDVLKELNLNPAFVICVRNPYEIAASLKKRNHLSQEKSLLLWMDYQVKAEYYSRNFPRIFISYFEFLKDPAKILTAIKETLHPDIHLDSETEKQVMTFLDRGLKHHNLEDQLAETAYLPQIKELFDVLNGANLRDLSTNEITIAERIKIQFSGMIKFFSGLSQKPEAVLSVIFNDQTRITQRAPVKYGTNELVFPIESAIPVSKIICHPMNSWVGIKVIKIEGVGSDHVSFPIKEYSTNSNLNTSDDVFVFETEMPELTIEFPSAKTISRIIFKIDYLAIGQITNRMASDQFSSTLENLVSNLKLETKQLTIQKEDLIQLKQQAENQQNEIIKLSQNIKEKERTIEGKDNDIKEKALEIKEKELKIKEKELKIKEKESIINEKERSLNQFRLRLDEINASFTWRVGRIITAPARFTYKMINRSK